MTIKYHENGIWVERLDDSTYRIGLSEKGQDDVGEVMFAELSVSIDSIKKGDALLNVEGAKAVTEITIPFDATVTAINEAIEDEPSQLNQPDKVSNWIVDVTNVDASVFDTLDGSAFEENEENEIKTNRKEG